MYRESATHNDIVNDITFNKWQKLKIRMQTMQHAVQTYVTHLTSGYGVIIPGTN
jgi:hypothetical protein